MSDGLPRSPNAEPVIAKAETGVRIASAASGTTVLSQLFCTGELLSGGAFQLDPIVFVCRWRELTGSVDGHGHRSLPDRLAPEPRVRVADSPNRWTDHSGGSSLPT